MSENHSTPRPSPQPFCAVYAPLLPLLHSGELPVQDQASVEAHVADCPWCQNQLATFDVVDAALCWHYESASAVPFGAGSRTRARPALTLEDIMKADQQQQKSPTTGQQPISLGRPSLARNTKITALGALAAVLVLAILSASLFARFGSRGPASTSNPAPTVTVQAQVYFSLLSAYYVPVQKDHTQQYNQCGYSFDQLSPEQRAAKLPDCRPIVAQEVADVQTLLAQLATAQPPARWQAAHAALTQAVQALATWDSQRLQAIDAHNVSQFVDLSLTAPSVMGMFCSPFATFNVGLPSASAFTVPEPTSCS